MFILEGFIGGVLGLAAFGLVVAIGLSFAATLRLKGVPIKGKHIVITGGSSGIGLAVAKRVLAQGCASVTLVARRENVLREAQASLADDRVRIVSCDVTDTEQVTRLLFPISTSVSSPPPVDILICSAGASLPARTLKQPLDEHRRLFEVNYFAVVACTTAAARQMTLRGTQGAIVIINSLSAACPIPGLAGYAASKAAARAFAEAMTIEVSHLGINVTTVYPPDVDTPMLAEENLRKPPECKAISADGGLFTADDIARDTVDGIVRYRPSVFTGFDGKMAGLAMTAGPSCSETHFITTLIQTLFLGWLRPIGLFYHHSWRAAVKRLYPVHEAVSEVRATLAVAGDGAPSTPIPSPQMGRVIG